MSSLQCPAILLARSALVALAVVLAAGCAESASQPAASAVPAPTAIAAAYGEPMMQAAPEDPALEAYQREQIVAALAAADGVERAGWSTETTLVVAMADVGSARGALCPIVERYPTLRATRLQLQPPVDSGQTVRFMQCKAY